MKVRRKNVYLHGNYFQRSIVLSVEESINNERHIMLFVKEPEKVRRCTGQIHCARFGKRFGQRNGRNEFGPYNDWHYRSNNHRTTERDGGAMMLFNF